MLMSGGRNLRLPVLSRLLLAMAAAAMILSLRPVDAAWSTRSAFAPEQLVGPYNDWEPMVATAPSSHWVYQAVTSMDSGLRACAQCPSTNIQIRASPDGGATWGRFTYLCPCPGVASQFDPQLKVTTNGTIDAVFMNTFDPGPVLVVSRDHGRTWTPPVRLDGTLTYGDKPILAISPTGRDIYVAFNAKLASYAVESHDYGRSFSAPIPSNSIDTLWWWFTYGEAVTPHGDVYFAQVGESGVHLDGPQRISVLRCTARLSCTRTIFGTSQPPPLCPVRGCYADFFAAQAAIASDPTGALVFAYSMNTVPHAVQRLYVRTSRDGRTWSSPILVSDHGDSNFPALASGPTPGDVRLAWQDNRYGSRSSPLGGWNLWFRRTTDGGHVWSRDVRLSNRSDAAPYQRPVGYTFPHGDYFGLAVNASGVNFLIWGEADGAALYCCGGAWYTKGT
jgi:hypothetical protein